MDAILKNAIVFTSDDTQLYADTLAVKGDRLAYVGKYGALPAGLRDGAREYDMGGRMITPGFCDSHTHPGMVSQSAWHIRLPWTDSLEELLRFVRDYAEKHPKEELPFLYFEYYPTHLFGTKGPRKEILDAAVSDRPCLMQDFGEHQHWVNSKMLACMEVTKDTPDPVPGLEMFVRDENGEPTGHVLEFAWIRFSETLFRNIGWEPPMTMTPEIMERFFAFLPEHGVTAVGEGILEGEAQMASMAELEKQGKLYCYYDGVVRFWGMEDLPEKIAFLREMQEKYSSRHLKLNTMKLFLDGTNESGNSALLTPHLNDATGTNFGEIKMDAAELANCFFLCNREGLDLHIHMVGDRAFRVGCDAVEEAQKRAQAAGVPWACQPVFAHCELISPDDTSRPASLGITVNSSCHWSGGYFGEEAMNYFSRRKWESMYDFGPLVESGALVCFSSDVTTFYELHRAHPLFGMQVAHTRIDPEFPLDEDRYPGSMRPRAEARLPRDVLLKGYTINSAKQMRRAEEMGSLTAGKIANLCVLSDNYFEVDSDKIKDIRFDAVVLDGDLVYGRLD
ncbi:MAG: amidohydrolase family protein [Clostridiales Family XIII bacterium]|jgi:predicted amidohydrolase YtcJ|nr:amidohydrolase family protein [Clostridiales Family XIII bacterium]